MDGVHFLDGNGLLWEVVVGKIDFFIIFADFLPIFSHFYFFGAFSYCAVGAFLAIFPIFLGLVGIFWGSPAIYFADFGVILAIFDHFWAIFGPFLGRKVFVFLPKNGILVQK